MDDSLKKLEEQLETLTPKGLSNEGQSRCEALIDQLSEESISTSPVGWSWKITSAAAILVLGLGMTSGWWLGKGAGTPTIVEVPKDPEYVASAFEIVDERSWMQVDPRSEVYLAANGEVREVRTEVGVMEETILHRDSGKLVTVRVTKRQMIDSVTNQF